MVAIKINTWDKNDTVYNWTYPKDQAWFRKKKKKTVPAAWSCSFTISYDAEKLKTIKLSGSSPVNY